MEHRHYEISHSTYAFDLSKVKIFIMISPMVGLVFKFSLYFERLLNLFHDNLVVCHGFKLIYIYIYIYFSLSNNSFDTILLRHHWLNAWWLLSRHGLSCSFLFMQNIFYYYNLLNWPDMINEYIHQIQLNECITSINYEKKS